MVVGGIVQEEVNRSFTGMLGPQQSHELSQLGLVDVLFGDQEDVFLGLDAIRAEDIVTLTAAVGGNQMRCPAQAPGITGLGVVLEMDRVAKVDAILRSQPLAQALKPAHKQALQFGVGFTRLPHPAHKEFGKLLGPSLDKVLVIDYVAKD